MSHLLNIFLLFRAIHAGSADPMFRALTAAVAFQLATGTVIYALLEDWNLIDALYFCVVASLTVGFGDFVPETTAGRLFTVVYLPPSVALYVAFGAQLATVIIEERRQRMEARRGPRETQPPGTE